MALFKVYRGNPDNLDSVPLVDGHSYVCFEDGNDYATFWTDVPDSSNVLHRVQIGASGPLQFSDSEDLVLNKNNWVGNSAPYTQTLTTTHTLANDQNGLVDLASSASAAQREAERNALLSLTAQTTNSITITADGEKPTVDLPITLTLFFTADANFAGDFATAADVAALYADIATVESSATSAHAYAVGEYLIYNNSFYKVTNAISVGGTITPGTNVTAAIVADELKSKQNALTFDSTPTAGSSNPVTSNGIKSAINNITPTSESIGSGHTLIRCGNLRILKVVGFNVGYATITIPVSDRPTSVTTGVATYSDNNEKYMTFGLVIVNTDGSIAYKNWAGYNDDVAMSDVSSKWANCPGVIWMIS